MCSTKIPDDKLQKFIAMTDEVLDESDGKGTKEVVPTSWLVALEKFQKYDVYNCTMETITDYLNTVLSNGNIKQHMDVAISDGPHTSWNSRIVDTWVVSQKEDDYLPVHAHSQIENGYQHSKISAVFKRSNSLPNFPCRIILKHVLSSSSFNEGWSSKMLLQQNCNSSSVERVLFASTSFTSLPTSAKIHPRTIAGLCFTAVWIFVPVSQASWGVKLILLSVINEIVESFR